MCTRAPPRTHASVCRASGAGCGGRRRRSRARVHDSLKPPKAPASFPTNGARGGVAGGARRPLALRRATTRRRVTAGGAAAAATSHAQRAAPGPRPPYTQIRSATCKSHSRSPRRLLGAVHRRVPCTGDRTDAAAAGGGQEARRRTDEMIAAGSPFVHRRFSCDSTKARIRFRSPPSCSTPFSSNLVPFSLPAPVSFPAVAPVAPYLSFSRVPCVDAGSRGEPAPGSTPARPDYALPHVATW